MFGGVQGAGSNGSTRWILPNRCFQLRDGSESGIGKNFGFGFGYWQPISDQSGIETPKDINRHFQTLHNKSWTLPRHPSDTPKHLLYGKCLTRHHRTLTRSMAPRVKVQATASRGPMWRRKSKPLGTKFLSLGHLRPKSAIPHPITIQNMKFERSKKNGKQSMVFVCLFWSFGGIDHLHSKEEISRS